MDAVITYVNMNDPVWKHQYKDTFDDEPNVKRFKDLGTINLQIKCIRKFMSWIDNIYVIVSTESQAKDIVGANIITHSQIIPEEYLPTFNSCVIEMFLHKIPNLSEYFIYFNDDMFPINYIDESAFFDEKPILSFKTINEDPVNIYRWQCKNSSNLARIIANVTPSKSYIKTDHICAIHSKQAYELIWSKAEKTILKSLTPKRTAKNFNQYLFDDYLFYSGQCKIKTLNYKYLQYKFLKPNELYNTIANQCYDFICIQDDEPNDNLDNELVTGLSELVIEKDPIDLVIPYIDIKDPSYRALYEKYKPKETRGAEKRADANYFFQEVDLVDLVVPYVDNRDEEWRELYDKEIDNSMGYGANAERFRSYDLFKYFFRGIEHYMSFINTIHLIVQSDSQVPEWIDRKKVHIVKHEDFIPQEYLPTFNSCTIEMFLHKIPELSEKFIYANDDIYAIGEMSKSDFFKNDTPRISYTMSSIKESAPADCIRYNVHKLITKKDDRQVEKIQHIFIPYYKSTWNEVWREFSKEIKNSITRVRSSKNLSQWLFAAYQIYRLNCVSSDLTYVKTKLLSDKIDKFSNRQFKVACFNDDKNTTIYDAMRLDEYLKQIFPNKSKFEL